LDRLERIERPQEHVALNLHVHPTIRSGREVVTSTPLRAGYMDRGEDRVLVATPELRIERGDRVALIGQNGTGKSTLLKTIVGQLPPLQGRVGFGTNVKTGYYAQGHEGLPLEGTPLSILLSTQPMGEEAARTYLARFLFRGDEVLRPVSALSGGERSRLALACLLVEGANLLVLDEPTNHLDIQSRETLEEMLAKYDGTVLFVSHDRFFIDRVATRVWEIVDDRLVPYLGNYTDAMRQKAKAAAPAATTRTGPPPPPLPEREVIHSSRRNGGESAPRLERKLLNAEREIGKLEGRLNELSDAIAIAGIDGDRQGLERLSVDYAATQEQLDGAYAHWEQINAQLATLATGVPAG
jgi:ATP-binding cassette subfamily F protein 3